MKDAVGDIHFTALFSLKRKLKPIKPIKLGIKVVHQSVCPKRLVPKRLPVEFYTTR